MSVDPKTLNPVALFSQGYLLEPLVPSVHVRRFIDRFRAHYVSVDLQRVGPVGDGGYLLPPILDQVGACFSPGVAEESGFESQLSRDHGIRCFLADGSVAGPSLSDPNLDFEKMFIGTRNQTDTMTLSSWVDRKVGPEEGNMLLQMDIEAGEYDVLTFESIDFLKRFSCMVIEFHWFQRLFDLYFLKMNSAIFDKLFQAFSICHVHPNNCCRLATHGGVEVPVLIEVTFLRNDLVAKVASDHPITLPHPLDHRNLEHLQDVPMPEAWWKG